MVGNALELIYYTFGKVLSFLLGCTFETSQGTVSLLFIMFSVFLFGILFRFFLSVPRTYRGQRDGEYVYSARRDRNEYIDRSFKNL